MNIFEIQQSKQDKEFVMKNGSLEFEVFADILKTAEDIPYIGSLFKLGKVALNYMDYCFVRKLHYFLAESENIDPEKKERFLLYTADEDDKATLMGKIYRSRLMGDIDDEMMLRLCSVVNRAFLADLEHLEEFANENDSDDYIRDNLNALGLLQDLGNARFPQHSSSLTFGNTIYKLNRVGKELLRIKNS